MWDSKNRELQRSCRFNPLLLERVCGGGLEHGEQRDRNHWALHAEGIAVSD